MGLTGAAADGSTAALAGGNFNPGQTQTRYGSANLDAANGRAAAAIGGTDALRATDVLADANEFQAGSRARLAAAVVLTQVAAAADIAWIATAVGYVCVVGAATIGGGEPWHGNNGTEDKE